MKGDWQEGGPLGKRLWGHAAGFHRSNFDTAEGSLSIESPFICLREGLGMYLRFGPLRAEYMPRTIQSLLIRCPELVLLKPVVVEKRIGVWIGLTAQGLGAIIVHSFCMMMLIPGPMEDYVLSLP